MNNKFKILSLDGGGVRGYLSILILAKIELFLQKENNDKKSISEYFDLISGTSTGSIIAALLATGESAQDVLSIYKADIEEVFREKRRFYNNWLLPKYKNKNLIELSNKYWNDLKLKDVETDLVVPAINLTNGKYILFSSDYKNNEANDNVKDCVIASCSAPTYFKAHQYDNMRYIDGGLVANNPTLLAMLEALNFSRNSKNTLYQQESSKINNPNTFDDLLVVSIGTGELTEVDYDAYIWKFGKIMWATPAIKLLMENQSSLVHEQVSQIMDNDNYLRINPKLGRKVTLDAIDKLDILDAAVSGDIVDTDYIDFIISKLVHN